MKTFSQAGLIIVVVTLLLCPPLSMARDQAKPSWWAQHEALAERDGYRLLRPPDLKALYDKGEPMVIIDARTVYEFRAGHLPGARNVEFHMGHARRLDPAMRKKLLEALGADRKRRVVIYDQGLQCVRGQLAAQWAVNLGYENVWQLPEGWVGWIAHTQTRTSGNSGPGAAKAGDKFPKHHFTLLDKEPDRAYLGLSPDSVGFDLNILKADYALVELYNELCFACCQSVPELNRLRMLIAKDPALAGRLKMMGIGVGNRNRDVHRFKKENRISFPLFSDHDRQLHRRLGEPALPAIYLVRLHGPAGPGIVAVESAPFGPAEALLKRLKEMMAKAAGE